jgi:hypothetical protein
MDWVLLERQGVMVCPLGLGPVLREWYSFGRARPTMRGT